MQCKIDPNKCIGCGTCAAIAPASFKMNDETNKADAVNPPGDSEETVKMAVESCPTVAIVVE
ncbi:MAG: ferredoxin [Candidatus Magasanikbacteria bacterium]|nr:ferredoxin [Candidatus Magasanikbacteria bacterium]